MSAILEGGPLALAAVVLALAALALHLERESTRPDLFLRAAYLREGLDFLPRAAGTLNGAGYSVIPGLWPLQMLVIWSGVAMTVARPRAPSSGRALWIAAVAVPLTAIATDFAGGDIEPGENSLLLNLTFVGMVTSLWLTPSLRVDDIARLAKLVLGAFLAGSLVAIVLGLPGAPNPPPDVASTLPGVERVSGMFGHANALGPAALFYLLLDRLRPSPRWARLAMNLTAVVLLILSQSKTAWAAALVVLALLVVAGWDRRRKFALIGACSVGALAILAFFAPDPTTVVEESPVPHVTTLTGRTDIWELGIERWRRAPLIGQGTDVFREIARETGQPWAGQAHNSYVAALAEHGLIGLAATLAYVGVIGRLCFRHAGATRNVSLAFLALLLARTMTETPLNRATWEELTLLSLLLAWERTRVEGEHGSHPEPAAVGTRRTSR